MFRKLTLLLLLLIPVFASQAMTITFGGMVWLASMNGSCAAGDYLGPSFNSTFAATSDDGGAVDWSAFVLYDAYGTALGIGNQGFGVGVSGSLSSVLIPITSSAQARPFTLKYFDTSDITTASAAASYPLLASVTFDPAIYGTCTHLPYGIALVVVSENGSAPHFIDGRLNNFDMASPFVVYGQDFEEGRGLVVYSPEGDLLLTVRPEAFAVECTGETIELASENGVTLYLLPSCEYQMMARSLDGTKNYVLIFNSPYPDTGYTSYEE